MAVSTMSFVHLLIFRGVPDINLCPKSIICLKPREGRVKADGGIDLVLCPSSRSDSPTSDGSTVPEQPRTRHLHTGRQAQVRASIKAPKRPQIVNKPTLIIFSIRLSSTGSYFPPKRDRTQASPQSLHLDSPTYVNTHTPR